MKLQKLLEIDTVPTEKPKKVTKILVKNKKTGNVYSIDKDRFDSSEHQRIDNKPFMQKPTN
ncbi:MAG: hypothetical protein AABY22_05305 [Nanoarchaeota archaeon]